MVSPAWAARLKVPDFKGIENFHLVLFFIVPGLITVFVRSRFIAGRRPSHTEQLLSYLVVSLMYYTITLPYVMRVLALQLRFSDEVCSLRFGLVDASPA